MSARDEGVLTGIARRLARLRWVPTGELAKIVADGGACMEVSADDGPPRWLHEAGTDRELAARLCRGCPVQQECLELELQMFGDQTVGVWGALGEDDRRALVPHWRRLTGEPSPPVIRPRHEHREPGRGER
jgi:WhiB family transcriptional regulator, redox-sensing transcriptional regulator